MIPAEKLYIATIADDAADLARTHGLGLELDEFCTASNLDADFATWDKTAREKLACSGRHVFHAPFAELSPAAIDPLVLAVVEKRYAQTYALCHAYGIGRMVVHAGFLPEVYHPEWFHARSVAFWRGFLQDKPDTFQLLIENVLEDDPAMLAALVDAIDDPRVRICLDIGHANARSTRPLSVWIDTLAGRIAHVHLHNNDGSADTHQPLFEGSIPVRETIERLLAKAPDATFTLEMAHAGPSLRTLLDMASAPTPDMTPDMIQETLQRVFGYDTFREGQRALIDAQCAGQDVLGIMPTGSGKSVCFQVPALLLPGITLVVSPLISLMKDQVTALIQSGVRAAYLNSSLTERQMDIALRNAEQGQYKLIYVAPERLLTPRFLRFAMQADIALVAVDEAHCISQWGQDFRPNYLDVPAFVQQLPTRPVVSAFTATATPQVKQDIVRLLALQSPLQIQTGFDRPNLHYEVLRERKKDETLLRLVSRYPNQSGIIYCATRKNVEKVCAALAGHGLPVTRYHAGLSDVERRQNQEDFSFDRKPLIVATNAFGMGIDKSNVRFIIHYNMPKDLESYYQEAGRAGRDGERADCFVLYSGQDVVIQKFLIEQEDEDNPQDPALRRQLKDKALSRLRDMVRYCTLQRCLRQQILEYFGEDAPETCGFCGNCTSQTERRDVTGLSHAILRCVQELDGRYGLGTILLILRGSKDKRLRVAGLDQHALYGLYQSTSRDALWDVSNELVADGYLTISQGQYPVASITPKGRDTLAAGQAVLLPVRETPSPISSTQESAEAGSLDPELFESLRALRLQIATKLGVPAFVIFTDATLRDMAQKRPTTISALLSVKGVGDAKAKQYGDTFLQRIQQFSQMDA